MPGGQGGTNDDQGAGSNNRKFGGAPFIPFKPSAGGLAAISGKTIGRGSDNTDVASLNKKTKYSTGSLSYPLNVEGDPQQGHFIMFGIKEQNKAKLKAHKFAEKVAAVAAQLDPVPGQVSESLAAQGQQQRRPAHNRSPRA